MSEAAAAAKRRSATGATATARRWPDAGPRRAAPRGTCRRRRSGRPAIGRGRQVAAATSAGPSSPTRISRPPAAPRSRGGPRPGGGAGEVGDARRRPTSWWLTPTRSARASSASARRHGASTARPAARSRRKPCQPMATTRRRGRPRPRRRRSRRRPGRRPGARVASHVGERRDRQRHARAHGTVWTRPVGVSRLSKTGASASAHEDDVDAGPRSRSSSVRRRRLARRRRRAPPSGARAGRSRARVGHAAAEPPAARIVGGDVAAGGADVHDLDRGSP